MKTTIYRYEPGMDFEQFVAANRTLLDAEFLAFTQAFYSQVAVSEAEFFEQRFTRCVRRRKPQSAARYA